MVRKPRTGEAVIVPPRRYVLFHPGSELKAALRKPEEVCKFAIP
jgi:nucleoid DNA-binding protein